MNNYDFYKTLTEHILKIIEDYTHCKIVDVADKIVKNEHQFSGTLNEYHFYVQLKKCVEYYIEGKYDASLICSYNFLIDILCNSKLNNVEDIKNCVEPFNRCVEISSQYDIAKNSIDKDILEEFNSCGFAIQSLDDFSSLDIYQIEKSINSRYFKVYNYSGGCLPKKEFKIKDHIVASDSIYDFLSSKSDDYINVTVGLYIEKKIDLSYFMITFSYKDSVWFLSDKPEYTNIRQIAMLRGGGRRFSEDRENYLDFLPYKLIDDIISKRNESKTITKQAGSEIYTFDLKDNFDLKCLFYIIKFALQSIWSNDSRNVSLYDGRKLIGDNIEKNYFCKFNTEELDNLVEELHPAETLPVVSCTSLIKEVTDSITFASQEEVERNVQYLQQEKIARSLNEKQRQIVNVHKEALNFQKYISDNLDLSKWEKIIFSGNNVELVDINHITDSKSSYSSFQITTGVKANCECKCGHQANVGIVINFKRYTEMMLLLDCKREELPVVAQNYLSHIYIPYYGNNILDNVNPKYVELSRDPLSQYYPNAFSAYICICKSCLNKKFKQYKIADRTIVLFSSKDNKIIDIIPYESIKDYEDIIAKAKSMYNKKTI